MIYNCLPTIGSTIKVDRPLTSLLGDFSNSSFGYVISTKTTLVAPLYDIETALGDLSSTNLIDMSDAIDTFRTSVDATLGDLAVHLPQTVLNSNLANVVN